ncbi:MAG TPA: hypothetical protein VMG82_11520 [Candidatus Sulfotelmatobacter sp.]|nr:hypothetical protein [Candidatus Sulfotelmatobacter sp.]
MPTTPSVDVSSGNVTNGPIHSGQTFVWTSSAASGTTITVYARNMPTGQPWFQSSPVTFTTPSASAQVTAEAASPAGGWTWTAKGVKVSDGAHVNVSPTLQGTQEAMAS